MPEVTIVQPDGRRETVSLPQGPGLMNLIEKRLGADYLDVVNLRDGRIMIVDDLGHPRHLPVNDVGTRLYRLVSIAGNPHVIRGPIAVALDADFADVDELIAQLARDPRIDAILAPPEPFLQESPTPSPWAVICRQHARVFLTQREYRRQMNDADAGWTCPRCGQPSEWDDETYEQATAGER